MGLFVLWGELKGPPSPKSISFACSCCLIYEDLTFKSNFFLLGKIVFLNVEVLTCLLMMFDVNGQMNQSMH